MNKKKIIVFGLGSLYVKAKEDIEERYSIVAYTDNNTLNSQYFSKFIDVSSINEYEYDFILVVSSFYNAIKAQLLYELNIDEEKILQYELSMRKLDINEIKTHIKLYNKLNKRLDFKIDKENLFIITNDISEKAGTIDQHYFYQDIWAAKKILLDSPNKHYDVGSRVDGFISHILVFMERVTLIDIRPLNENIKGVEFLCADATNMNGIKDNSIESLSSLHVIEHFGLGRYGDEIDPEACFKAMKAFQRVIKPKGKLYLSVPIGKMDKVCFNAHRIFSPLTIIKEFNEMQLIEFSYISNLEIKTVKEEDIENETKSISDYSCGLFEFIKK